MVRDKVTAVPPSLPLAAAAATSTVSHAAGRSAYTRRWQTASRLRPHNIMQPPGMRPPLSAPVTAPAPPAHMRSAICAPDIRPRRQFAAARSGDRVRDERTPRRPRSAISPTTSGLPARGRNRLVGMAGLHHRRRRRRPSSSRWAISAISVMPGRRALVVNDTVVRTHEHSRQPFGATLNRNSARPAGPASIPSAAEQRHRVDCSLRARWYELWTQIDPSQTACCRGQGVTTFSPSCRRCLPDARARAPIRAVVPGRANCVNAHIARRANDLAAGRFRAAGRRSDRSPAEYGVNLLGSAPGPRQPARAGHARPQWAIASIFALPARADRPFPDRRRDRARPMRWVSRRWRSSIRQSRIVSAPAGLRAAAAFPGFPHGRQPARQAA